MYGNVYVFNVPIRSISGTHSLTEEDLGLPAGTLPPEELASIGNLKVVDKKLLAPIEKIRAKTKRFLTSIGVRVGMGTVVTTPDFDRANDALEVFKSEFYDEKAKLLACFGKELQRRIDENPEFAELISRYAPDVRSIERRLSFDIDVYKIQVVDGDPNQHALAKTLSRDGNDWSKKIISEVAEFISNSYKGSIEKSQKLVKQNLGPLRETLLPKIRSFELLDSSLSVVAKHLESFIDDVSSAIDARPTGHAFIDGSDLKPFEKRLNQLRSVMAIKELIAAAPKQSGFAIAEDKEAAVSPPTPKPPASLPKRSTQTRPENGSPDLRPMSF